MYFIKRESDEMWLLNYRHGLNSSGRPTGVWGDDARDAMPFRYVEQARALAAALTGCIVVFKSAKAVV